MDDGHHANKKPPTPYLAINHRKSAQQKRRNHASPPLKNQPVNVSILKYLLGSSSLSETWTAMQPNHCSDGLPKLPNWPCAMTIEGNCISFQGAYQQYIGKGNFVVWIVKESIKDRELVVYIVEQKHALLGKQRAHMGKNVDKMSMFPGPWRQPIFPDGHKVGQWGMPTWERLNFNIL